MPTYDYDCKDHGAYDVIRSIKEYKPDDPCPKCGVVGSRVFSSKVHFIGASVQNAEYNPGLGCVTKNKKDREEIAKKMGLEEVGSEKTSTLKKMARETKEREQNKSRLSDSDIRHLAESWK